MITSRKQGILALTTKSPYKIASGGMMKESNEIICKDITYQTEGVAYDIEQLFSIAMLDVANKNKGNESASNSAPDTKIEDYQSNDCPSDLDIAEQAQTLEMFFKMNSVKKVSELVELFSGLVEAGLIMAEGMTPMHKNIIWSTISRDDRTDIMFKYLSFFINPFARLQALSGSMELKPA